jgi:hypothetical protein
MSSTRPLMPASWGHLIYDGSRHCFAFEQLSATETPSAYITLCRRRVFADEAVLTYEREIPDGACQACRDELLAKAATLAGALHGDAPETGSSGDSAG